LILQIEKLNWPRRSAENQTLQLCEYFTEAARVISLPYKAFQNLFLEREEILCSGWLAKNLVGVY
jgi:hypothetical protein